MYCLAYVVVAANSFLFYTLLRRLSNRQVFAVTGALAFALFPADTNQACLTTALGSQPSLTFFLLASHCYLSGRRIASYLLIAGSLLCYETVFPLFIAVPLLNRKWDAKLVRQLLGHAAILGAMIAVVTTARKLTGDGVVSAIDLRTVVTVPFLHMLVGPAVSMAMFFYRPAQVLGALDKGLLPFLLPCLLGFAWLLQRARLSPPGDKLRLAKPIKGWFSQTEVSEFFRHTGKLALTGLMLLVLAYPLTFTVPATTTIGRATRVHLAGVVGASILFACLSSTILYAAASRRKKWVATAMLAALFAALAGFGLSVQRDYKLAWQYQRALWTDVAGLCPDLTDGTVILLQQTGLRETKHIRSRGWHLSYTLRQLYRFPRDWDSPPLLYTMAPNWRKVAGADGSLFSGVDRKGWILESIPDPKFILLVPRDGRLTRPPGPLVLGERRFPLKEIPAPGAPPFETRPLHDYLIMSPGEAPVDYIRQ